MQKSRCLSERCFENTFTGLMILWSVVSLGLAIYGAVQLNTFSRFQAHYGNVWEFGVTACVLGFILPFVCAIELRSFVNDQGTGKIIVSTIILEIAITIWAIIIFHDPNSHIEFWMKNANELLVAVYAQYSYIGIYAFLMIFVATAAIYNDQRISGSNTRNIKI